LKRSMSWDEVVYGREYDLDVFNIVAVSDFNMGAMENKGLNIFNDKYVLASPDLATDADIMHIEAIIAHEYFHNWTGNRITCRDWFQLCLKEGFTVYRDQEFSADMRSRPVQRIDQVRALKAGQFSEDAGPLAHPVRPGAYKEINNFYTATVYQKGAELVRMLATIVGPKTFRAATDLYFERHDGEAAVMEDFVHCFEEAAERDFSQFMHWYEQAGTPTVSVEERFDAAANTLTLTLSQSTPATPGQSEKQPVPIPIRLGLLSSSGEDLDLKTDAAAVSNDVILLDQDQMDVVFEGLSEKPTVSLLRGFSAPVNIVHSQPQSEQLHLARHDSDLFNRWQALNTLVSDAMVARYHGRDNADDESAVVETLSNIVFDDTLEPAFSAQALSLPTDGLLVDLIAKDVDAERIHRATSGFKQRVGETIGERGLGIVAVARRGLDAKDDLTAAGIRSFSNAVLSLLVASRVDGAVAAAFEQHQTAATMTDRHAALLMLARAEDATFSQRAIDAFFERHKDNALALDKWFSAQSIIPGAAGLKRVEALLQHPHYTLSNPNRARSVLALFAMANPSAFHQKDGSGYRLFGEQVLRLDGTNPQLAARLMTAMNKWRAFEPDTAAHAKTMLEGMASTDGLSRDVSEIVERCLA
ncbi:MAG: aminopeptidase N, partial [Pseudomonadota bacterium]